MHWREQAACRGTGRTMWLEGDVRNPREQKRIVRALTVCRGCPVLDDCRRWVDQLTERMVGVVIAGRVHPIPGRQGRGKSKEAA